MTAELHLLEGASLPRNMQAERGLLGAAMLSPSILADVSWLRPEHFYADASARIWAMLLSMDARGVPIDLVSFAHEIEGHEEKYGGAALISTLSDFTPSVENADYYARLIREAWQRRDLIDRCRRAAEIAHSGELDEARAVLESGGLLEADSGPIALASWIDQAHMDYWRRKDLRQRGIRPGLPLGFPSITEFCAPEPGEQIVLAARPGMGKTSLALNLAANVARVGIGVAFFSLEMTGISLAQRLACQAIGISAKALREGCLPGEVEERLWRAMDAMAPLPFWADETPGLTIEQIRMRARRLKAAHPEIGLVVVDHIGLPGKSWRGISLYEQAGHVTKLGKEAAKELDVVWLALSQLSRKLEERGDKRPILSDLRDSGNIEEHSDAVIAIFREDYYMGDNAMNPNTAEIIVRKNRNGPTGTARLAFDGPSTCFTELRGSR